MTEKIKSAGEKETSEFLIQIEELQSCLSLKDQIVVSLKAELEEMKSKEKENNPTMESKEACSESDGWNVEEAAVQDSSNETEQSENQLTQESAEPEHYKQAYNVRNAWSETKVTEAEKLKTKSLPIMPKKSSDLFTPEMNRQICLEIRSRYPGVITEGGLGRNEGDDVFSSLMDRWDMKIPKWQIRQNWTRSIEPVLIRHQAGTLNKDYRADIICYMVNNGLKYANDVKWDEVARLPEFLGSTGSSLKMLTEELSRKVRVMLKKTGDATAQEMQEWYNTKDKRGKKSNIREREKYYIDVWFG